MHYFLSANGSKGKISYGIPYPVIRLYGYSPQIFTKVSNALSEAASKEEIDTEFIHSCMDGSVSGILFPALKKGVINVELNDEQGMFISLSTEADKARKEIQKAHAYFGEALAVHDEWEKYYISNLDFAALDREYENFSEKILSGKWAAEGGIIKDRFLGAATEHGAVDYIEDITENIETRYFIKGRPGSGKSTFLKKVTAKATERGYNVERYHCSFDPQSLDMIVICGLNLCIFDSTAPHEHFPRREKDYILDFYDIAAKRNIDREYKEDLSLVAADYREKINNAVECIANANAIYKDIYSEQEKNINISVLEEYIEKLKADIFG